MVLEFFSRMLSVSKKFGRSIGLHTCLSVLSYGFINAAGIFSKYYFLRRNYHDTRVNTAKVIKKS